MKKFFKHLKYKIVIFRCFLAIKKLAKDQLSVIKQIEKTKKQDLEVKHLFLFKTVHNFWELSKFGLKLIFLGMGHYATYPVRTMLEIFFKLDYFYNLNQDEKEEFAQRDLLSSTLKIYKIQKFNNPKSGFLAEKQRVQLENTKGGYNSINMGRRFPDIEQVSKNDLKNPSYEEMVQKSKNKDAITDYNIFYRWLSEIPHATLLSSINIGFYKEDAEFRRVWFIVFMKMFHVLEITNSLLNLSDQLKILQAKNKVRRTVLKVLDEILRI